MDLREIGWGDMDWIETSGGSCEGSKKIYEILE
jgi:hypothetical protein